MGGADGCIIEQPGAVYLEGYIHVGEYKLTFH